jgi:hypothetical protein
MSRWGAEADRDLLLTIIKDQQLSTAKWGEITAEMEAKGYKDLGPWACRCVFQYYNHSAAVSTCQSPQVHPSGRFSVADIHDLLLGSVFRSYATTLKGVLRVPVLMEAMMEMAVLRNQRRLLRPGRRSSPPPMRRVRTLFQLRPNASEQAPRKRRP